MPFAATPRCGRLAGAGLLWLLALGWPAVQACELGQADGMLLQPAMTPRPAAAGASAQPTTQVRASLRVKDGAGPQALPPQGRMFSLVLRLCPAEARLIAFDAWMPEHRHGMNYRPSWQPLADGGLEVNGLLLHMPGRWQWRARVQVGEAVHALVGDFTLR